MDNAIKFKIKKAFYNYEKFLKSCVISTVELAEQGLIASYDKLGVQGSKSNTREAKLCGVMDKASEQLRWCYVVEKTLEHFKFERDKVEMIRVHYFNGKGDIETCLKVGITRRTFYYWQNEVLEIAYNWAKELKAV